MASQIRFAGQPLLPPENVFEFSYKWNYSRTQAARVDGLVDAAIAAGRFREDEKSRATIAIEQELACDMQAEADAQ